MTSYRYLTIRYQFSLTTPPEVFCTQTTYIDKIRQLMKHDLYLFKSCGLIQGLMLPETTVTFMLKRFHPLRVMGISV
jgi:hypothetical protein